MGRVLISCRGSIALHCIATRFTFILSLSDARCFSTHTLQSSVPPDAQVHRFQLTIIIIPSIQKKHVLRFFSSLSSLLRFPLTFVPFTENYFSFRSRAARMKHFYPKFFSFKLNKVYFRGLKPTIKVKQAPHMHFAVKNENERIRVCTFVKI